MKRSIAALAAATMLAASFPSVGFAEDAAPSDDTTVTTTTTSASPCESLTGLLKAQCMIKGRIGKDKKKDAVERRNDAKALRVSSDCKDKVDDEKVDCIRKRGKRGIKHLVRKAVKSEMRRTIRGKLQDEASSESSED